MKSAALMFLMMTVSATLASAQVPRWCFGLPCLQSPRLDFTVGKDYEHALVFRGDREVVPSYKSVQPLEPLSITRQFFTLTPPTLNLTPAPSVALPAARPGVVHAPIQPVIRSAQLSAMPAPPSTPPEPVNPNSGSFSTGVGMPSFTLRGPH